MADARADDRLPWLEPERRAAKVPVAARRARRPLLILLALFAAAGIALLAFLAGRSVGPAIAPDAPRAGIARPAAPPPARPLDAPIVPPPAPREVAPTAAPPAPLPAEPPPIATTARRVDARPSPAPRAARAPMRRPAAVRHAARRHPAPRPPRVAIHRGVRARPAPPRVATSAFAVPRRLTRWPARPFAGRGRVIQLGAYRTLPQANAAWWRLVRVYPYLGTLPRTMTATGPTPGRARTYRLRLAAGSGREARQLCANLYRIGRGCGVL